MIATDLQTQHFDTAEKNLDQESVSRAMNFDRRVEQLESRFGSLGSGDPSSEKQSKSA